MEPNSEFLGDVQRVGLMVSALQPLLWPLAAILVAGFIGIGISDRVGKTNRPKSDNHAHVARNEGGVESEEHCGDCEHFHCRLCFEMYQYESTSNKVKRLFGRGTRRPRWPNEAENYIAIGFDEVETPTE